MAQKTQKTQKAQKSPKTQKSPRKAVSNRKPAKQAGSRPAKDKEDPQLAKQVGRHLRVGGSTSGLAVKLLLSRLTGAETAHNAEEVKRVLGSLKGPLMKIAQLLATVPDALPPAYIEALQELQSNAPPMGKWFVARRMQSELGADWQERFDDFNLQPAHAASLGQVHFAKRDGKALAVKLQYPDMESAVTADLAQMKLALAAYRRLDATIDARRMLDELAQRLAEELDYQREAAHQKLFASVLAQEDAIAVPLPIEELSTKRLLTMHRLSGMSLVAWLDTQPNQAARTKLAEQLLRAWYLPFYRHGILHGDPHLGNYTVAGGKTKPRLNLLDYGCVRVFPQRFVQGVLDLYVATRDKDTDLALRAYQAWGFEGLESRPELLAALNLWAEFIYGPQLENKVQPIVQGGVAAEGSAVAAQVYQAIKAAGGVSPPGEFVLMDRSAVGLASVFSRLGAELNWCQVLGGLAEEFVPQGFAKRQEAALTQAGVC